MLYGWFKSLSRSPFGNAPWSCLHSHCPALTCSGTNRRHHNLRYAGRSSHVYKQVYKILCLGYAFCGLIAGTLLWAGLVEIWVKLGAKAIGAEEQKVMELTLAIIIPLILYFLFNENTRCNLFISLRKVLHTQKGAVREIPIETWGPRTAFKMFTLIWMGHVALFFAYDPDFFGTQSLFCKIFFISCLIGGTYLFYRLTKAEEMGFAYRYAIPTVVVIWSCIETLAKWKILSEPWITLNPAFLTLVVVVFVLTIVLIRRAEKAKAKHP